MDAEAINGWISAISAISAFLTAIPAANLLAVVFVLCLVFPSVRKRLFGNGNGNYITREEMQKHIDEDHKKRDAMFEKLENAISKIHDRIDAILHKKGDEK